jgi:hypothetical protein
MQAAMWITLLILVLSIGGFLFGADSRPGFFDGRFDHKERWFIHSRRD